MTPDRENTAKWLRLHLTKQVGSRTFAKLLDFFGDIDSVLSAGVSELADVSGISRKKAMLIANSRDNVDVERELNLAEKLGVKIITIGSDEYPPLLRQIYDPPAVLYVRGNLTRSDKLSLAVVGSRNCSQYGREQASRFSHLLASAGFSIVSGMARGIDSAAHNGALAAKGRTIAVQGCGLGHVFPPENADLAQQISESGAVVSELPLELEPLANNFPARNRIISGLSLGTLVVEARQRSGAQITARLAMEHNREVMAIPGRIDAPGSSLCHQLIKEGAKLVENVEDILEALGYLGGILTDHAVGAAAEASLAVEAGAAVSEQFKLNEAESKIIAGLDHESVHIDQLISTTGLAAGQVNAAVTSLQLKGLLRQMPGSYYAATRKT